jgi:hypothetical protein
MRCVLPALLVSAPLAAHPITVGGAATDWPRQILPAGNVAVVASLRRRLWLALATCRAVGNDITSDIGGPSFSNALDVVSDDGEPRNAGSNDTFAEVHDLVLDDRLEVFFDADGGVVALFAITRVLPRPDSTGPGAWFASGNALPHRATAGIQKGRFPMRRMFPGAPAGRGRLRLDVRALGPVSARLEAQFDEIDARALEGGLSLEPAAVGVVDVGGVVRHEERVRAGPTDGGKRGVARRR